MDSTAFRAVLTISGCMIGIMLALLLLSEGFNKVLAFTPPAVARWTARVILAGLTLLVGLAVLVPLYGSGLHVPSSPPGFVPGTQADYAELALFRGTIWENNDILRWVFWNVGCYG